MPNHLGWNSKAGTHTSDSGRGRGNVGVGTEVKVKHQCIGAFDQDFLSGCNGLVHVHDTVDDVGFESLCQFLPIHRMSMNSKKKKKKKKVNKTKLT